MFEFLMDMGNYEARCVDRSDFDWGYISTARVSDGRQLFETAVKSNEYAKVTDPDDTNAMTIVEAYDSTEDAQEGHDKWVKTMTESPPDKLIECCNAGVAELGSEVGCDFNEVRVRSQRKPS